MTLAYSYIRWSSEKQTDGTSHARQASDTVEYCERMGMQLSDKTYLDAGKSAYRGDNAAEGALRTFLNEVDAGKIAKQSYLIIENLDRLSRLPPRKAVHLLSEIVDRGITLVTLEPERTYTAASLDEDDRDFDEVVRTFGRSHRESKRKSNLVNKAWRIKLETWKPGDKLISKRGPAWLKANATNDGWDLDFDKVEVVQRIFQLALTKGQTHIVQVLRDEQVPTMVHAKEWSQGIVGVLLRNPAVTGQYTQKRGGSRVIQKYFTEIVSRERWLEVQAAINDRSNSGGTSSVLMTNLFRQRQRCLYCGGAMRYVPTTPGYSYLQCTKSYPPTKTSECTARSFPYNAAETAVLDRLMNAQQNMLDNQVEDGANEKRIVIDAEIALLKEQRATAARAQIKLGNDELLVTMLNDFNAQIATWKARRAKLDTPVVTDAERASAIEKFQRYQEMKAAHAHLLKTTTKGLTRDRKAKAVEAAADSALTELRVQMHQALLKQLAKVEFGPDFQSSKIWAEQGKNFLRDKRSRFKVGETPDFIVQLTFHSGKVRIVDADPWINARSVARRKASLKP